MQLLGICNVLLEKYPFRVSSHFLICLNICINCLYILDTNILSVILRANIFSHSLGYLFILSVTFFVVQKILNLIGYNLFIFALIFLTILVRSECRLVVPDFVRPHGLTVHGILQAKIQEWVAFPFSRESSRPRNHSRQIPAPQPPEKNAAIIYVKECYIFSFRRFMISGLTFRSLVILRLFFFMV